MTEEFGSLTQIDKGDFAISVLGNWREVSSDEGWEFVDELMGAQLIVTVLRTRSSLSALEVRETVDKLIAVRKKVLGEMSEGTAEMGETLWQSCGPEVEARVTGYARANAVQFSFVVRGSPTKFVTAAMQRGGDIETASHFHLLTSVMFDSLRIGE